MMGSKSDQFVNDLVQFYRNKGHHNTQPQQFVARINGKIVDLNQLYSYVIESGGSFKVTQLNLWDEIYSKLFRTPTVGANISVALRQIYARYLLPYEKVFSTNYTNDLLDDDEEDSNFSFSSSHNHSHTVNNQNSFTTPAFTTYPFQCLPTVIPNSVAEHRNPINKLFCSLLSGLPNELDFALKVSTILINSNRFNWVSDYRFIELLLECSKNYCCVCDQPYCASEEVCATADTASDNVDSEQNWSHSCNCYNKFWYQCCSDEQTLELTLGAPDPLIDELPQQDFTKIEDRIRLIGDIIRNLSFSYDSENADAFSLSTGCVGGCSTLLMKFLLLLANCSIQKLNYIAFDILSNIAPITAFIQEDNDYRLIQQILYRRCVEVAMTSNDIHWTSRALEVTARLLSANIEEFNGYIESFLREYEVFARITQLMTCQYDITLLLSILELCFALSQQRPNLLVKDDNKHLIKILLTLLNIESSQHFSSTALKRMKVIDDRPRNHPIDTSNVQQAVTVVTSGHNSCSQLTVDNETFAMNWLRSTYEPTANVTDNQSLKASDVYAEYVKHSCRNSRRNVMAAQPFSQLVKKCFPSSSLTNNQTTIEGLVVKSVQTVSLTKANGTTTPLLMSPILKAHLSAPPKPNSTTTSSTGTTNSTSMTTTSTQSSSSTTLSVPTTNTSTLIKSLLANKLRSNATLSSTSSAPTTSSTSNTTVTPVTPTKSTIGTNVSPNPSAKVTPLTSSPVPIISTAVVNSNSTISETNGEFVVSTSPPLPSAITITPSVSTISLTPNNTQLITTSNATISAQSVQPQQQFLLVRTIITAPGQQQSGNSLTASGTPVRLILPASMLTQQRLTVPTVNGMVSTASNLTNMTLTAANSAATNPVSSASDLFLKTVLSNSSNMTAGMSPMKSNVKSSPLLNVLLDKGVSTTTVLNNQVSAGSLVSMSNSSATFVSSQTPKMYILTTKSPMAMKSLPSLQTQSLNQTMQCVPQTQLSPVCATLQTQNTSIKSCLQNSSNVVTTTTSVVVATTTTVNNHSAVAKQSIPKSCSTTAINGEIGSTLHSPVVNHITNNVVNSEPTVTACPAITSSSIGFINNVPSSDLSPFKEIKKTVDDATRLLTKRPNESGDAANKKIKLNSVLTTAMAASGLTVTHNSIQNHDSNSCDSTSIPLKNLSNNSQQVLTKALSPLSTSPIPSTVATTLTTITSNNIKPVCNTNLTNGSNKDNNLSANTEFECQWNDCKKTFNRASEVFLHVHNHHIMPSTFPSVMTCLWGGQEGTGPGCLSKRPKLSLLTHLLDFHCNPNVLQQENVRKKQISSVGSTSIVLPQPPAHPGYAHNAALLAIRRHANNYVEAPTLPPTNELTPLTVSIRLTSALILRNLAIHSNFVKRTLETFEQYLCELCMSDGRDESRTIAQCLALISDQT